MGWIDPSQELGEIHRWFTDRSLELELFERSGGRWRAVITSAGESKGTSEFVDGLDELDAARRAKRRHSTRQLRMAMDGLSRVAQSEVVQLLAAEVLLARLPMARSRIGRQAALASAVWMLDPERRKATRTVGRVAGEWARLRVGEKPSAAQRAGLPRPSQQELLPAALGIAERGLGRLKGRLGSPKRP
jgi:hypothetical protein